ncbi:MAG: GNAT family N-acetyltransferase [Roseovarius sp.]|nr:GNAT family N-acetyltransferase [Roseovarius sp.]
MLNRSGVRLSLMAEIDGMPAGFVMARVDYGEFGQTADEAVMEAIGVDPAYAGQGVGRALMSQLMGNLTVLRAGAVRSETDWNDIGLIGFLDAMEFAPAQKISLRRPV